MYNDPIFEKALQDYKEESYAQLKNEVKSVESAIEKFLSQILECSATVSERDFNMCSI